MAFDFKQKCLNNKFYIREILLAAFLLFSLFFCLSIFSFNPADHSYFYFSSKNKLTSNLFGMLGANFSALMLHFFGIAAYFFAFFLFYLFSEMIRFSSSSSVAKKLIIGLLTTVLISSIFYSFDINILGIGAGVFGESLFLTLSYKLSHFGSTVILTILTIFNLCLIFDLSFKNILLNFGSNIYKFIWFLLYKLKNILIRVSSIGEVKLDPFLLNNSDLLQATFDKEFTKDHIQIYFDYDHSNYEIVYVPEDDFLSNKYIKKDSRSYNPATQVENIECDCLKIKNIFSDHLLIISIEKFRSYKVRPFILNRDKHKFLDKHFLPNSVLSKNIFNNISPYLFFSKLNPISFEDSTVIDIDKKSNINKPVIEYKLPDLSMFELHRKTTSKKNKEDLEKECLEQSKKLEEKLTHFGIKGFVSSIRPGPIITLFEYTPDIDTKISKIIALEDDLALALRAVSIRIIAPIPGRSVIGFEIANQTREAVLLSDILLSKEFSSHSAILPLVLGVDIIGDPVIVDLTSMPHLLVAGSTGSGKSVGLNSMLMSLLCKLSPDDLKLILVDPKRLEFAAYSDIPHLLFPILTDARKVSPILKWVVSEMEHRYEIMSKFSVRNLLDYNLYRSHVDALSKQKVEHFPWLVIIIDELADVMMVAGKEIEQHVTRIAQMARAAGIHMIVATQRPSVDVVTGLIKVNFPSRVSYRVSSKIDSKTILDSSGAEKLLGRGDMLYLNPKSAAVDRVHGPFVSDNEIKKLSDFLRKQRPVEYLDINEALNISQYESFEIDDSLYPEVVEYIKSLGEVSISMLQRKYRIGFNRSARLIERLEHEGLLAPAQGSKARKVIRL